MHRNRDCPAAIAHIKSTARSVHILNPSVEALEPIARVGPILRRSTHANSLRIRTAGTVLNTNGNRVAPLQVRDRVIRPTVNHARVSIVSQSPSPAVIDTKVNFSPSGIDLADFSRPEFILTDTAVITRTV